MGDDRNCTISDGKYTPPKKYAAASNYYYFYFLFFASRFWEFVVILVLLDYHRLRTCSLSEKPMCNVSVCSSVK